MEQLFGCREFHVSRAGLIGAHLSQRARRMTLTARCAGAGASGRRMRSGGARSEEAEFEEEDDEEDVDEENDEDGGDDDADEDDDDEVVVPGAALRRGTRVRR